MWETYEEAITNYTTESIIQLFLSNFIANKKKYDELIEFYEENFYPFSDYYHNETYEHTRTPDLESESNSIGSGSSYIKRNESKTTTNTPGMTTTSTHSVNPYDASGLRSESQDVQSESGSTSITETYSGNPDTTTTSSSASNTTTTTGTDKNEYEKIIHGRTGKRSTSEVVEDGLKAAALHDILDIIISDIADQIFIQVWI